jgi:DNA mismatch endonuclease (patch repair protein)
MDRISPEERSRIMSHIRSKDTKPEKRLRSLLHRLGFRFRLHRKDLPGTPDIVLPKYRTVIFVHGCFWHQHPGCKKATLPRSNVEFWKNKLEKNIERDKEVEKKLIETGWNVIVIWECEIKKTYSLI